jgi:hypothetical protein
MGTLLGLGLTKTFVDPNLYYLFSRSDLLVLVLYVDDMILTRSSKKVIARCKAKLAHEFEMKDIALMHCFLGLEVWQSLGEVFLKQGKYVVEIQKRIQMMHYKPLATPMIVTMKLHADLDSNLVDTSMYR